MATVRSKIVNNTAFIEYSIVAWEELTRIRTLFKIPSHVNTLTFLHEDKNHPYVAPSQPAAPVQRAAPPQPTTTPPVINQAAAAPAQKTTSSSAPAQKPTQPAPETKPPVTNQATAAPVQNTTSSSAPAQKPTQPAPETKPQPQKEIKNAPVVKLQQLDNLAEISLPAIIEYDEKSMNEKHVVAFDDKTVTIKDVKLDSIPGLPKTAFTPHKINPSQSGENVLVKYMSKVVYSVPFAISQFTNEIIRYNYPFSAEEQFISEFISLSLSKEKASNITAAEKIPELAANYLFYPDLAQYSANYNQFEKSEVKISKLQFSYLIELCNIENKSQGSFTKVQMEWPSLQLLLIAPFFVGITKSGDDFILKFADTKHIKAEYIAQQVKKFINIISQNQISTLQFKRVDKHKFAGSESLLRKTSRNYHILALKEEIASEQEFVDFNIFICHPKNIANKSEYLNEIRKNFGEFTEI